MPVVRKLAPEEVQTIERKGLSQRKQREMEYDALVSQFMSDDYIELTPDPGETRPTIRHQINAAAQRAGVEISWLRGNSDVMKLKVTYSPFSAVEDQPDEAAEQEELVTSTEENGTTAALAEFELPEPEPEPAPVATPAPAKKAPARKAKVTDRQPYVEAP